MPRVEFNPSVSIYCPYCSKHTEVTAVQVPIEGFSGYAGYIYARWEKAPGDVWWLGKTHCCNSALLVQNAGQHVYPAPQPSPTDAKIPSPMKEDVNEAKLCASVGAWRGCAVLARRAIQSACIDKGAKSGDKLVEQVKQLNDSRVVTPDLVEWASEVRHIGNDAAHPNGEPVSQGDAEDILKLAEQFLHVLYVTPAIAAERKAARQKHQPPSAL